MKIVIILLMTLSFSTILSAAVQIGETDRYTATPISGNISITCSENGRRETRYVTCHDNILSPYEFAYLHTDEEIDATHAQLTAFHSNGKTQKKKVKYKKSIQRSKKRINLWIDTVFQNPLLDYGNNKVTYEFFKNKKVVQQGEFEIFVEPQPERSCRRRSYYSSRMNDCRFPSNVCDRYFRSEGYCE